MSLFILDTDTFSLLLRGHARIVANVVARRLNATATTIITVEEELGGWYTVLRRTKDRAALARTYSRMTMTVEALAQFRIVTFSETALGHVEVLRKQHPRIGRNDLCIAAIAMESQATLVTRNRIDFGQISGLSIEDWSL